VESPVVLVIICTVFKLFAWVCSKRFWVRRGFSHHPHPSPKLVSAPQRGARHGGVWDQQHRGGDCSWATASAAHCSLVPWIHLNCPWERNAYIQRAMLLLPKSAWKPAQRQGLFC